MGVWGGGGVVAFLGGGWADPGCTRRWQPDTLVNVFSVGKGLVAACAARLAGQGRLDVDAAVTSCWPQFGAAGKDAITIRQLLSHQAGPPAVRRRLPPGLGFCDPQSGIAFGYVMNQMGPRWQNPRTRALIDAVYACL